jgi:hypothetical protein
MAAPETEDPKAEQEVAEEPGHFVPVGTVAILAVYFAVIVLLWLSVYLVMVSRGTTG